MCIQNVHNRNTRHRFNAGLQPKAEVKPVQEPIMTIRCDRATLVVRDTRLVAWCCR